MSFKAKAKQKPPVIFKNLAILGAGNSPGQRRAASHHCAPCPTPSLTSEGQGSRVRASILVIPS